MDLTGITFDRLRVKVTCFFSVISTGREFSSYPLFATRIECNPLSTLRSVSLPSGSVMLPIVSPSINMRPPHESPGFSIFCGYCEIECVFPGTSLLDGLSIILIIASPFFWGDYAVLSIYREEISFIRDNRNILNIDGLSDTEGSVPPLITVQIDIE